MQGSYEGGGVDLRGHNRHWNFFDIQLIILGLVILAKFKQFPTNKVIFKGLLIFSGQNQDKII